METGVNSGNTLLGFATITPKLHHVDLTRLILPSGIPGNHFFPFITDISHHFGHKLRIGKMHFICSNMEIWNIKRFTNLIQQEFQDFHSFRTLHIMTESTDKCRTMSGHINLRNQQYLMSFTELGQLSRFLQRVIFTRHTSHIHTIIQHRKDFTFQTPCLIFRQVPMKGIDFKSG